MNCMKKTMALKMKSRFCLKQLNGIVLQKRALCLPTVNSINSAAYFNSDVKISNDDHYKSYQDNFKLSNEQIKYTSIYYNTSNNKKIIPISSSPSVLSPPSLSVISNVRLYSAKSGTTSKPEDDKENSLEDVSDKELTTFQKFKKMYRDYWYVLLPVHAATSVIWFGGFYYTAKSGFNIVELLEFLNISESLIEPFRNGNAHVKAGYIAVALALYKIATPVRYAVTLGGATIAINYLQKFGYIKPKPIPKKDKLKQMYQEQKDMLLEKKQQLSENVFQKCLKQVEDNKRK